jgi:hypothetical protein
MRYMLLLTAALALACQADSATEPQDRCSRPDSGQGCSQSNSASYSNGAWHATVYTTTSQSVTYTDGGFVCYRTVFSCSEKTCHFIGPQSSMTAAGAIAACAA